LHYALDINEAVGLSYNMFNKNAVKRYVNSICLGGGVLIGQFNMNGAKAYMECTMENNLI